MAQPSRPVADDATPIGRTAEAARLTQLIDDAAAGAKRAALLLGAPGIGKSALLRCAHERAQRRGMITSYVRVPAAAGLPPRFPLGGLLGGLLAAFDERQREVPERLSRVVATLIGATSVDEYAVSLPQIADAFEEAGRLGPLGLFVDDYDWAPPEGTELLIAALRVVETPICFMASARLRGAGDEPPSPLPAPTADLWIDHIEVRGLDPASVSALASSYLGNDVLPSLADALFARTLGNPLFVIETLQAWLEGEALIATGGFWGLSDHVPRHDAGSLRDMITARLAKLTDDALAVAGIVAVVGRETGFEELQASSGLATERVVDALSRLAADGFVVSEGGSAVPRFRMAHPLYVSAVIEHLGAARVAAIHGAVADQLRQRASHGLRVPASERAHHAVRALPVPSDLRALLARAAQEAESAGAYEEAAVWYGHCAELADDPAELVRALIGQAASSIASDPARAVQLFTMAIELERDETKRAALLLGRARAHRVAGMFDPAIRDLEGALPLASPTDAFDIRHAIGVVHAVRGDLTMAERTFRTLMDEYRASPQRWKAVGHLGLVALVRGDMLQGTKLHEDAFRNSDDPAYVANIASNLSWLLVLRGRWDEAARLIREKLSNAVSSGNTHEEVVLSTIASRLSSYRGELAEAFDSAQRALRLASRLGNPANIIAAHEALALALLENDMPSEAAALLPVVVALDEPGIEPREYSHSYVVLAEASLLAGDIAAAREANARARQHLPSSQLWKVAVDRVDAQIACAAGDPLLALDRLRPWLETATPIVFHQAQALAAAAEASWILGDRASALSRAQEGLRIYEELGASRRAARLGSWLVERTARRPGRPRSTLPGHLTERETETLRLVVLGRSNQEIADELFISIGTVKKHIENIMTKAGVSRRTELVPFAVGIGVLAMEDLKPPAARSGRRVIRLDRLDPSEPEPAD